MDRSSNTLSEHMQMEMQMQPSQRNDLAQEPEQYQEQDVQIGNQMTTAQTWLRRLLTVLIAVAIFNRDHGQSSLSAKEKLDLWTFYEKRAIEIRGQMITTITWLLGLLLSLLGYIFLKIFTEKPEEALSWLFATKPEKALSGMTLFSLAIFGAFFSFLSLLLLSDFRDHIKRNYDKANKIKKDLKYIDDLGEKQDGDWFSIHPFRFIFIHPFRFIFRIFRRIFRIEQFFKICMFLIFISFLLMSIFLWKQISLKPFQNI
jgi:hypothetical protein